MTKPIAIIGTSGRLAASSSRATAAAFAEVGHNSGNIAFQHAVTTILADERIHIPFDFDPAAVREQARMVCIPAANFLYAGFDLGGFADRLAATGLPLMVLGLGAQAFRDIAEVKLQPGTERLLRLFAERCVRIAVRGRHTGAVLERFGVTNFAVLGCPSNFINPDPALGAAILAQWRAGDAARPRRIAYAPTFYSYNAAFEGIQFAALGDAVEEIVAQDPLPAVALARGDRTPETAAWLEAKAGFLSVLAPEARSRALRQLRVYFDAEAWMESYRRLDAVIGTRIHGVNLGWQSGRPALVVSYDLRTEELAETMGLPLIKSTDAGSARPLEALAERIEACAGGYDARRAGLAAAFAEILLAHGATPAAGLRGLVKGALRAASPGRKPAQEWGFLEQYNASRVAGWVASDRDAPPRVLIRLDGRDIGEAAISGLRAEIGPRAWSFSLAVPSAALTRDVLRVEAVLAATGAHLANSPVTSSFAEGNARKVLPGREGWLFLQNDTNGVIDQVQGKRRLSDSELDQWAAFLRRMDAAAMAAGGAVVHLVAPSKECVAAEYLPNGIALSEERPVRQLEALVGRLGLVATRFLYPLDAMRRPGPHAAYPQGDSHWNDYGAALALAELRSALGLPAEAAMPQFRTEWRNSDLLSKLGGVCVEPQPVRQRALRLAAEMIADNKVAQTGRQCDWRSLVPGAAGRLLLVHDSFGDWLIPHLVEHFAQTTTLWGTGGLARTLAQAAPSMLVFERAERFLVTPPVV